MTCGSILPATIFNCRVDELYLCNVAEIGLMSNLDFEIQQSKIKYVQRYVGCWNFSSYVYSLGSNSAVQFADNF